MIPKIIHYCWFGRNPLPPLALECIASWKKYLPDYEIWQWSEGPLNDNDNENENLAAQSRQRVSGDRLVVSGAVADKVMTFDVNIIPYTAEAYKQKKYAFVSDYARFWIMYKYGGIYFDTDVEVIRPMDDIIEGVVVSGERLVVSDEGLESTNHSTLTTNHYGFMGFEMDPDGENTPGKYAPRYCFDVALGLGFGMEPQHPFMKMMMEHYDRLEFVPIPNDNVAWYKTIVAYTTEKLCEMGLKNVQGVQKVQGITVYPSEYFAPINAISRRMHITENTHTIHRYMASWGEQKSKSLKDYIRHYLPEWVFFLFNRIKRQRYKTK